MDEYKDDLFINIFLWLPSIICIIIFLYGILMKRRIGMKEFLALLGAFIGALIAGLIAIWKENKNSKGIMEKVQERHTTQKAKEYHKLTMQELEKEFNSNKERILDAKEGIKDISSSVSGISTDIQLMSKDIENHILNLKEVRIQEPSLIQALKIFEGYIQELGKAERQIQTLENEKGQLISQYEKEICELKLQINSLEKDNHELHEQNEKLLSKYKDVIENDDFGLEI